jgi:lantibiotic modifying enzyme
MPAGQGLRAWPTHGDLALTGFAHGAAGIAYALARLHAVTGDLSYFDAAVAGIEYERSALCEDDAVKWCHGAPGVALGRVGCLGLAVDRLEEEIEIGLRATESAYLQDADFLCCGNLGRAEAFLVAGSELGRPEWRRLAVAGAAHVVSRARDNGRYTLFGDMRSVYNPGFFQGMAGIGYQLLRTGHGELPSVLLWQCPVRITAHGSRHRSPA